jgi:hypothetical protein
MTETLDESMTFKPNQTRQRKIPVFSKIKYRHQTMNYKSIMIRVEQSESSFLSFRKAQKENEQIISGNNSFPVSFTYICLKIGTAYMLVLSDMAQNSVRNQDRWID